MKAYAILAVLAIMLAGTAFAATNAAEKVAQAYYPYYNTPDVLVFSGVGVNENNAVSNAVFVALDKQQIIDTAGTEYLLPYKTYYIIVDGKATQLKIKSISFDKETQTLVAQFVSEQTSLDVNTPNDKEMTLIVKQHTTNYQNVVVASGTFDRYLLNMKLYSNENIYTIMPAIAEKQVQSVTSGSSQSGSGGVDFVKEAIAKIGRK